MSDLISRSEAVNVANGFTFTDENQKRQYMDFLNYCLENAPTVEAKPVEWIPCSERLPKKYGWFLITGVLGKTDTVDMCYWNSKEWLMHDYVSVKYFNAEIEIIAWMPLPTPYNADMRKKVE